jgi:hypothetical protein
VPDALPLFDLRRQWPGLREEALATFERVAAAGAAPWWRSERTVAATASSSVTTAPASPIAPRFLVG